MNGTFIPPTNGSTTNGGVTLGPNGWIELAGIRSPVADGASGSGNLTVIGGGNGTVNVGMNFLSNQTITFDTAANGKETQNHTLRVGYLYDKNVVTMFQTSGNPFIDAVVVG